jgi:hypothetical protein
MTVSAPKMLKDQNNHCASVLTYQNSPKYKHVVLYLFACTLLEEQWQVAYRIFDYVN